MKYQTTGLALLLLMALLFSSCGIQRPQSYSLKASFSHSSFQTSCATCHERHRPAPVSGVPHGNGGDCVTCHVTSSWKKVTSFSHNPVPTSCSACHEPQRPAPVAGIPHGNSQDCVTCHVPGDWKQVASFSHTPLPTSCSSCHQSVRPAVANYPNTAGGQQGHYVNYANNDCYACHQTPVNAQFQGSNHWPFIHKDAALKKLSSCLPCHYNDGAKEHGSSSNYLLGNGTCQQCHSYSSGGWD